MKSFLFLLLVSGLFATRGELPKVEYVELSSNLCCVQGPQTCACCEDFFGQCKNDWVFEFWGRCIQLPYFIREIRDSRNLFKAL